MLFRDERGSCEIYITMCGLSIVYKNKCLRFIHQVTPFSTHLNAPYRKATHRINTLTYSIIQINIETSVQNVVLSLYKKQYNSNFIETHFVPTEIFAWIKHLNSVNLPQQYGFARRKFVDKSFAKRWKMMTIMKVLYRWVDLVKIMLLAAEWQYWKVWRSLARRHDVIVDEIEGIF